MSVQIKTMPHRVPNSGISVSRWNLDLCSVRASGLCATRQIISGQNPEQPNWVWLPRPSITNSASWIQLFDNAQRKTLALWNYRNPFCMQSLVNSWVFHFFFIKLEIFINCFTKKRPDKIPFSVSCSKKKRCFAAPNEISLLVFLQAIYRLQDWASERWCEHEAGEQKTFLAILSFLRSWNLGQNICAKRHPGLVTEKPLSVIWRAMNTAFVSTEMQEYRWGPVNPNIDDPNCRISYGN